MTKLILVMGLTATLILSTFTLGNTADAFVNPNDTDKFKITSKGNVACTNSFGDDCGTGKQKSRIQLVITQVDEDSFSGVGKTKISMKIHQMGGLELIKGETLAFAYVPNGAHMVISGPLKASNGSTWQFDMNITDVSETKNDRFQGECASTLTAPNGTTIVQPPTNCGLVLNPINS